MDEKLKRERFIIIDGNAIVHRAYHALPHLTNSKGEATNAVHGFFSMIFKIFEDVKPTYIAVAFDRPKPTFRKLLYVGYQASRPSMDDGLSSQFKMLQEILSELKIPVYGVDGFEADDVIGTIARKISEHKFGEGMSAVIVTGDRDLLQLVNHHTFVLSPVVGMTQMVLFDTARVEEKYNLVPKQIIDLKSLMGDASDNYPGVPGIGPKTAQTLLSEYKTVDGIYENISKIEKKNPKLALRLAEGQDQAMLGKTLATIVTDVPFVFNVEECAISNVNREEIRAILEKYGLMTLAKRSDVIFGDAVSNSKKKQMKLL